MQPRFLKFIHIRNRKFLLLSIILFEILLLQLKLHPLLGYLYFMLHAFIYIYLSITFFLSL